MKHRCNNPKHLSYKNYGALGIRVVEEWQESFEQFVLDMGPKPSSAHSLDRRENTGDYTAENCRWATNVEQSYNKRTTLHITFKGKTQNTLEWAEELGLSVSVVTTRWRVWGDLLKAPPRKVKQAKLLTYRGEQKSTKEWAKILGLGVATVSSRYKTTGSLDKPLTPAAIFLQRLGITKSALYLRRVDGWSDEQLLKFYGQEWTPAQKREMVQEFSTNPERQ